MHLHMCRKTFALLLLLGVEAPCGHSWGTLALLVPGLLASGNGGIREATVDGLAQCAGGQTTSPIEPMEPSPSASPWAICPMCQIVYSISPIGELFFWGVLGFFLWSKGRQVKGVGESSQGLGRASTAPGDPT